jgi:hypothetical protein
MNRKECLETALEIVMKDRQNDYGTPEANFATIAEYWTTYLNSRGLEGYVTGFDVAAMMALLKIARIASSPAKEDNWVDLAGYAANGAEIAPKKVHTETVQVTYTPDILSRGADTLFSCGPNAVHVCTPCEDTQEEHDGAPC